MYIILQLPPAMFIYVVSAFGQHSTCMYMYMHIHVHTCICSCTCTQGEGSVGVSVVISRHTLLYFICPVVCVYQRLVYGSQFVPLSVDYSQNNNNCGCVCVCLWVGVCVSLILWWWCWGKIPFIMIIATAPWETRPSSRSEILCE